MEDTHHAITYAGKFITFQLHYANRRTMEIAVYPNGSVSVKAPLGTDKNLIEYRIHKRARWILRQIRYFSQFEPRTPPRLFIGGESHLYLGRKYRLKIRLSDTKNVVLKHGFFHISTVDGKPEHIEQLLEHWYRGRADVYFPQVFDACWHHFLNNKVNKPLLKIRNMKTRWGSVSRKSGITLNLQLIKAPRECIEYVIIHELCHLLHANHGKEFYNLLEISLPDWEKRKHKLEIAMC